MDKNITHKKHVEKTIKKAKEARAKLSPLIGRRSKLSLKNKLTLINTIIAPILTYASLVWGSIPKTQKRQIQAQHNISLGMAVNAPWYVQNATIFRDLGQTQFTEKIK